MVVFTDADAEEMKRLDERFQAAKVTNDECGEQVCTRDDNVDRNNHDAFHATDNASVDPKAASDPEQGDNMKKSKRKEGKARAKRLEKARLNLEAMPEEERNRLEELIRARCFAGMPTREENMQRARTSTTEYLVPAIEHRLEELDRQERQIDGSAAGSAGIPEQMWDESDDEDEDDDSDLDDQEDFKVLFHGSWSAEELMRSFSDRKHFADYFGIPIDSPPAKVVLVMAASLLTGILSDLIQVFLAFVGHPIQSLKVGVEKCSAALQEFWGSESYKQQKKKEKKKRKLAMERASLQALLDDIKKAVPEKFPPPGEAATEADDSESAASASSTGWGLECATPASPAG
jgi:hypothetical protein